MKIKTPIILLIFTIALSCNSEETPIEYDLIGSWIPIEYTDTFITVIKSEQLESDKQGFIFQNGGKLVKRETIQVVNDTPVAYWDFDGTWGQSDSFLSLKVEHWDGTDSTMWKLRPAGDTLKLLKVEGNKL